MIGTTAKATQGDAGYINKDNILTADQQSLRLMLDDSKTNSEWSTHLKIARLHLSDIPFDDTHSSSLFRYKSLSTLWIDENDSNNVSRLGYEIDRLFYKKSIKNFAITLGRQSIDWGSGRFWQPLNVFGSFAPTDLDTDYKPGIDATRLDWFPSDFSSLSAVYILSPNNHPVVADYDSSAVHYRRQIGQQSELSLVAAGIIGHQMFGAAYESNWGGMGWRFEGLYSLYRTSDEDGFLWIAGLDYQFSNGTLIAAEWYNNNLGASNVNELINFQTNPLLEYGLQHQTVENVFGLSVTKDITPLLNGSYFLLASPLKDFNNQLNTSLLHQFNFSYSVSDESDILTSIQFASGQRPQRIYSNHNQNLDICQPAFQSDYVFISSLLSDFSTKMCAHKIKLKIIIKVKSFSCRT